MKKINEDLEITAIEISMLKQVAIVKFMYLGEYKATGYYSQHATGYNSLEMDNSIDAHTQISIETEVEENEADIIEWVDEQFELAD